VLLRSHSSVKTHKATIGIVQADGGGEGEKEGVEIREFQYLQEVFFSLINMYFSPLRLSINTVRRDEEQLREESTNFSSNHFLTLFNP
jgi:hypothetical protein